MSLAVAAAAQVRIVSCAQLTSGSCWGSFRLTYNDNINYKRHGLRKQQQVAEQVIAWRCPKDDGPPRDIIKLSYKKNIILSISAVKKHYLQFPVMMSLLVLNRVQVMILNVFTGLIEHGLI